MGMDKKNWLKTKINEFKMLSNTLAQSLENNADDETVEAMKKTIEESLNNINETRKEIEFHNEEKVFSFYDGINKDEKTSDGFINVYAYSSVKTDKFTVDLSKELGILEVMVTSVSFDLERKLVSLCINDTIVNVDGKPTPILNILTKKMADGNRFNFSIYHLNNVFKNMYAERYCGCKIDSIYRDPLDISMTNETSRIQIFISYEDVYYEAAN
jgi:hypothetical protein